MARAVKNYVAPGQEKNLLGANTNRACSSEESILAYYETDTNESTEYPIYSRTQRRFTRLPQTHIDDEVLRGDGEIRNLELYIELRQYLREEATLDPGTTK